MKNTILGQFLVRPLTTGAIWPSSRKLCRTLLGGFELEKASTVVELGPGTGAATGMILENISSNAKFFAVELNTSILTPLKRRYPDAVIYNDSASNLPKLMSKEGVSQIDVIISGLPWASFSEPLQEELLSVIYNSLAPGGVFTTFAYVQGAYLPTGRKFNKRLRQYFPHVKKSRIVWMNLPPAFVYRCRKTQE